MPGTDSITPLTSRASGTGRRGEVFRQGLDLRPRPIGKLARRIEESLSTAKHREVADLDEEQRPAFAGGQGIRVGDVVGLRRVLPVRRVERQAQPPFLI